MDMMMVDGDVKQILQEIERETVGLKQHPKSKARWCTEPYGADDCAECKMWHNQQQDCRHYCD